MVFRHSLFLGHTEKIRLLPERNGSQSTPAGVVWLLLCGLLKSQRNRWSFRAEELRIGGKKVIDWFTNYLLANEPAASELGGYRPSVSHSQHRR